MATSTRPIFVATHPRACSTAFERVFMTRRDILECAHEPFGDAFYYGPERLSERYENDEEARRKSGFANSTYKTVIDRLESDANEGKRLFIKDLIYYTFPPEGKPAKLAPSLCRGSGITSAVNGANTTASEDGNPTVIPTNLLRKYHFTFLIRHPRRSIPSFYRCTIDPLDKLTQFNCFMPSEAGYDELRRFFDFLKAQEIVGPAMAGEPDGPGDNVAITVIDADDLLDHPEEVIQTFCAAVGIDYHPDMLKWGDGENQEYAVNAFKKWPGFHEDVLHSTRLVPRSHSHKTATVESEDREWREKYGEDAQKVIRDCVDANIPHYEYLKSYAIKF